MQETGRYKSAEAISRLCENLEVALSKNRIHAEDVEQRIELLRPLERALASHPQPPTVDNQAGTLAMLLWSKIHPEKAHLDNITRQLDNQHEIVRITALEALICTFQAQNPKWLDVSFLFRIKQLASSLLGHESSPFLRRLLGELKNAVDARTRPEANTGAQIQNPYVAGNPVRDPHNFFGREDVLDEICSSFQSGTKSVILHGARRTGKTSLLYRLIGGALGPKYVCVYLDMQGLAGRQVEDFYNHFLDALSSAVTHERESHPDELDYSPLRTDQPLAVYMSDFLSWTLGQIHPKALVVMLDEYEYLQTYLEHSDLAGQLLHLVESKQDFYFILAGSKKLETFDDNRFLSLLDVSRYIKISFLSQSAAIRLVTEGARGLVSYAHGVPEQLVSLTGCHPFYTQLLCQIVFRLRNGAEQIIGQHVDMAVDEFLLRPSPYLVVSWKALAFEDRLVAAALAAIQGDHQGVASPAECVEYFRSEKVPLRVGRQECQRAMSGLRDLDLLERVHGSNRYRFTVELVRRWIADNYSVWDLLDEYGRQVSIALCSPIRREWARIIDVLFAITFTWLVVENVGGSRGMLMGALAWTLFLPSFVALSRGTPGSRLLGIRFMNELGAPQSRTRLYFQALINSISITSFLIAGWFVTRADFDERTQVLGAAISGGWGLLIVILNTIMIHFGKRRQTLYDKLTHTVAVRRDKIGRSR
jgi:uncharacterized RDD family membrane protein YckC